jgi:apolipoprotein N-acyltransferase
LKRSPFDALDLAAAWLADARPITRISVALALGALAALSFEPYNFFPALLVSYAALVLLIDGAAAGGRPTREAALIGWAYGFGFFLVGLYWIGYAFLVDAPDHEWQIPFVAVLLPGGLGLFFAAATAICVQYWRGSVQRIFFFALVLFGSEWLRGHILTGFPWNLPGYGWSGSLAVLESASLFGVYGLSLLSLLYGASFAALTRGRGRPQARWLPAALTVLFVGIWADGQVRLITATDATVPKVRLRIVQPDTPEPEKYDPKLTVRNWERLIDLSQRPSATPITHIIWPEAAPPFALANVPAALSDIATLNGASRVLFTGTTRIDREPGRPTRYYNSLDIFGAHGKLLGTYDKFHLVPFGEYLPFESTLRAIGLTEIAANTGFSAGSGPETFDVPGAPPVGPLICYEVIFPQAVTGIPRPQWLVNVTDDSWFGPDTGPAQHLMIARVRAIEEGLPIVRAANSGISAIIDSYGRLRASLASGLRGTLDGELPVALPLTPFARYGNAILLALVLMCTAAAAWPVRPSKP